MNTGRTRTYPENPLGGADFVVGDVHGSFRTLERAMEAVDFNPERERVFAVGELVNRGSHSHKAIDWLERPGRIVCSAGLSVHARWGRGRGQGRLRMNSRRSPRPKRIPNGCPAAPRRAGSDEGKTAACHRCRGRGS